MSILSWIECEMVGKSKDTKANEGRKALENEWNLAVQAAAEGAPLIADASNKPKGGAGKSAGPSGGVYVAQTAGGTAKQRLKQYEEALAKANGGGDDAAAGSTKESGDGSTATAEKREEDAARIKEEKRLKKKAEKEAKEALEKRQEEERAKRRLEKERKEAEERMAALELAKEEGK